MSSVSGRAVQVTAAGGAFEVVQHEFPDPGPGHVRIRVQACGVCHSDSITKFGLLPRHRLPARTGPRSGRRRRCRGRRCAALQGGPARGPGLAWRPLQLLRALSARRFHPLRESADLRHQLRRRLCRLRDRPRQRARPDSRRPGRRGCRPTDVRRHNHLQQPAPQRSAPRRHSSPFSASAAWATSPCSSRPSPAIAPWPSRAAKTRPRSPNSSARTSTSTAPRKTLRQNCRSSAAPSVILSTLTNADSLDPGGRRPRPQRQARHPRRPRQAVRGERDSAHHGQPLHRRLGFRHRHGLRRHAELQRALRRQAHARDLYRSIAPPKPSTA